ncbi:hypothetical protein EVAR_2206_1 [Eumeta japonica]|uniref:Reverse transcriptase domain-containing protein n=1 Tax=Eumeta variegata TaxID=151549 RepID=A0A4C1SFG6_EUMVA|nr:hypothetical protein EVAR_2206_1 [Eumeta japonica]
MRPYEIDPSLRGHYPPGSVKVASPMTRHPGMRQECAVYKLHRNWCIRHNCTLTATYETLAVIKKSDHRNADHHFAHTPQEIRSPRQLYKKSEARAYAAVAEIAVTVRINGAYTDWLDIRRGIALAWLFNLIMDSYLYDLKEYECGLRMDELSVKCLLYADDQVVLALSACEL